jgi:hypothetical protein
MSSFTLCVRSNNNCGSSTNRCATFAVLFAAPIAENGDEQLEQNADQLAKSIPTLFPNPAADVINVKFEEDWLGEYIQAEIVGIDGRIYQSNLMFQGAESIYQTDISDLPKGIYMLRLSSISGSNALRFIKL